MKKYYWLLTIMLLPYCLLAQNNPNVFDKANNAVNKAASAIAVFQPYLLKARQLFLDGKQMAGDMKRDAKRVFGKDSSGNNNGGSYNNNSGSYNNNSGSYNNNSGSYNNNSGSYNNNSGSSNNNSGSYNNGSSGNNNSGSYNGGGNGSAGGSYNGNGGSYNSGGSPAPYLAGQSLPVNNPSTINNDATGNWGNQNNGLYGNCLDALTGTVMGMGEAASSPTSVDLLFFAPADGQNTYCIMTPGFARNNSTATYMTEHTSDQVQQWTDVNESEVAMTKLTIGQFNQIQNNGQIQNAVRNAQDYGGYYASVGQKLDGGVLAVRTQMQGRELYALVAVIKQFGTSGGNGYLKIQIKSTGLDMNHDGQVDANAYLRSGN